MQGAHIRACDITVLAGCGSILDLLFFILADEGSCVGIPAPYYPAFDRDLKVLALMQRDYARHSCCLPCGIAAVPVPQGWCPEWCVCRRVTALMRSHCSLTRTAASASSWTRRRLRTVG